jgi:hypothetical protein
MKIEGFKYPDNRKSLRIIKSKSKFKINYILKFK